MKPNRPSMTAQSVAQNILLLSYDRRYGHLVPRDWVPVLEKVLAAFPGGRSAAPRWLRLRGVRALSRMIVRQIVPGLPLHLGIRKRWVERQVLEARPEIVVVVGAGFDLMTWHQSALLPHVSFVELDHPATQAVKRRGLGVETSRPRENLEWVAADLGAVSVGEALVESGLFTPGRHVAWVLEGLLMYLPATAVQKLLGELARLSAPGSQLVGTALDPGGARPLRLGIATGRLVNLLLRLSGEPFRWGVGRTDLAPFLAPLGWQLDRALPSHEAGQTFGLSLGADRLPVTEFFFRSTRA